MLDLEDSMKEKMKALPPESIDVEGFSLLWERSSELRDVLTRLPSHLVLKSGLSSRRKTLVDGWDKLESPGLDGTVTTESVEAIQKWIHDAELSIAFIIQIGKQESKEAFGRIFAGTSSELEFETVDSLAEVDFVSDSWCFPWPEVKLKKKKGIDKDKLFKYGGLAALGAIALVTYLDED